MNAELNVGGMRPEAHIPEYATMRLSTNRSEGMITCEHLPRMQQRSFKTQLSTNFQRGFVFLSLCSAMIQGRHYKSGPTCELMDYEDQ